MVAQVGSLRAEPSTCSDCVIAIIKEGKAAPFDGFLYNPQAHADQRSRITLMDEGFELRLKYELGMQKARMEYTTSTTAAALHSLQKRYDEVVPELKDRSSKLEDQVADLNEEARGGDDGMWFAIGFGSGAVVVILAAVIMGYLGVSFGAKARDNGE